MKRPGFRSHAFSLPQEIMTMYSFTAQRSTQERHLRRRKMTLQRQPDALGEYSGEQYCRPDFAYHAGAIGTETVDFAPVARIGGGSRRNTDGCCARWIAAATITVHSAISRGSGKPNRYCRTDWDANWKSSHALAGTQTSLCKGLEQTWPTKK